MSGASVLAVEDLKIAFPRPGGRPRAVVDGVSLAIGPGQTLGLVGESGSGKTMVALSVIGLVPKPGRVAAGRIAIDGEDLIGKSERELRAVRGGAVSIVFQDPLSSLNPVKPVGSLLVRSAMLHRDCGKREARQRAVEMLAAVGIPDAAQRIRSYPHEFSGGQRQRIMIALAAINSPALVIADEPTTALDPTVQLQILKLLKSVTAQSALLLITHDLGVAAGVCDGIAVMRDGRIVETGDAGDLLTAPRTAYAKALTDAVPRFGERRASRRETGPEPRKQPLLEVRDLEVSYEIGGRSFKAVDGVSLHVAATETLGIVGESGSGKSTIAKAVLQMVPRRKGEILFDGHSLSRDDRASRRVAERRVQYVFQDPYSSLDPRWRVGRIIAEPLLAQGATARAEVADIVADLVQQVGLPPDSVDRFPAEFSGGQRQRIGIARALSVRPDLLIADEPVSSLDVTIQRKIVTMLKSLQERYRLALVFIAHDLPLVYQVTDRVVVLYLGKIVEEGPTEKVLGAPQHPYTQALLSASMPESMKSAFARLSAEGEPASPLDPPSGCSFHPRCPIARPKCAEIAPVLAPHGEGGSVACHFPAERRESARERR